MPVGGSNSQIVTLTNTGNADLNVAQVTVVGGAFTVNGLSAPLILTPSQSSSFTVQFSPVVIGSVSGSVTLSGNAVNSPTVLVLSGNGVSAPSAQLSSNPTSINFGDVSVGSASTQAVTLTNTGGASVTITQANVTGAGFSTSGLTLPLTLTPGQNGSFNVRFLPAATGSVTGSVSLVSNAANSPTAISLAGNGTPPPVGTLTINPSGLTFGNVIVGSNASQPVTLSNTGNAGLTITQANVTGAGFSVAGLTLPLTLAPAPNQGSSVTFTAQFAPATAGSVTGSVTFTSNGSNSPTSLALAGTGVAQVVQLTVSPTSSNFGNVLVGASSTQTATLTNTGNVDVGVSGASVTGAGFSISGLTTPQTLVANQSVTFVVQFAPSAAGSVTGSVSISSAAPTVTVALSGTGALGQLTLTSSSIDFGDVVVGNTKTQVVTITNTGNGDLTVTSVSVLGAGFSLTGLTLPLPLAPNQSSSFTVQFTPVSPGSVTGSVTVVDSNASHTISLKGNAKMQSALLTLSPTTIDFGNVAVSTSATQTATLTNTGNVNVAVNAASVTGAGFSASLVAQTLTPGQSVTFNVVFAPTSVGGVTGSAAVTSGAPTVTVALSGTGAIGTLTPNPSSINFGNVVVGNSPTQSVTLTNTGNASLTVTSSSVTGRDSA